MQLPESVAQRMKEIEAEWPEAYTTIYGPDSTIVYASANHIESGWTQADMIGSHWTKFVPPSDYQHGKLALEDAMQHEESTEIGVTGLTKFGQQVRMRVKGWRMRDNGQTYVLVRSLLLDRPVPPNEHHKP